MAITKTIVITGSPGTGKTALISVLEAQGYFCLPEISRQITLEARAEGIDQLFLKDALMFSEKLLKRRIDQFHEAKTTIEASVFIDRGIPDIVAYMDYMGSDYPSYFKEACEKYTYDQVFLLPPWKEIYTSDSERYENFQQAMEIHQYLKRAYEKYGYHFIEVPKDTVRMRANFIINALS